MNPPVVHLSDWAQQPDIRIKCTQAFTSPAWGPGAIITANGPTGDGGVYRAESGELYTFTDARVTCPRCQHGVDNPEPFG